MAVHEAAITGSPPRWLSKRDIVRHGLKLRRKLASFGDFSKGDRPRIARMGTKKPRTIGFLFVRRIGGFAFSFRSFSPPPPNSPLRLTMSLHISGRAARRGYQWRNIFRPIRIGER